MKSKKPVFKSFRKKILYKPSADVLQPNIRHGETLIPIGTAPTVVSLPKTIKTYTYDIINTDRLTSDLTVATTEGTLRGLILNTSAAGVLSIDPVGVGTRQIKFDSTIKDGSYISTLSDGADWFIWSFGIGAGLGQSTTQRSTSTPASSGLIGGSIGSPFQPVVPAPTYDPVVINSINVTVDYPSGPAEHDLVFEGTAEPNATLKVFDSVPTEVATVNVAPDGSWTFSVNDLANGQHEYTFEAFVGGSSINKNDFWSNLLDGGSLEFDCSEIQIEVGTSGPDFTVFPVITDPNGVSITPTVNSTTYSDSLTEDQTFNVVFDFVYDSVTYQRTVQGVVVNLVQPAEPVISTVGGNASGVAINSTTANIVGTAEPNATVEVWIDGIPNQAIGTVTANGTGDWTISSHDFGFISNSTVIVKAQQQTVGGSLWSNPSTDFIVVYEQNVLASPTVTANTFSTGDYTNQSNPFTISGTGVDGSEITLNGATPLGGTITVAGGTWSTTVNLSHDATHDITAQATKAGFVNSQQSTAFQLNVDRTAPTFGTINDTTLYLGNVNDTLPSANDSFDPAGVIVTPSYSPSLTNAEGSYVASYTATDTAGNSTTASSARTITVTTEPIVPVITSVTVNGDGTFTVVGTVTGVYADNLTVQVTIDESDSGSPVSISSGTFTHTTSAFAPGTYQFKAKSINSATQESIPSSAVSATISVPDTEAPVITIRNSSDLSVITNTTVSITEGDSFAFTATATDNVDGNISGDIVQGGDTLDINTAGTYNLTFDVSDAAGNPATQATLAVEVAAAASFVEDIQDVIDRASGDPNVSISGGIVSDTRNNNGGSGMSVNLDSDGVISYDSVTGETVNDEFTISFWAQLDNLGGNRYFIGTNQGRRLFFYLGGTVGATFRLGWNNGSSNLQQFALSAGDFTNWTHFVLRVEQTSTNTEVSVFINGSKLGLSGSQLAPSGTKILPPQSHPTFIFGGTKGQGSSTNSVSGQFDSIQFGDGVALSDSQINWIAQDSTRQRTIAAASSQP